MAQSADGLVERRIRETAQRLSGTARRWTAERGLTGFTVEEVCEQVGVSRRTFFNYFASKENAVLGIAVRDDESPALEEAFVAEGPDGPPLLHALVRLTVERWFVSGLTPDEIPRLQEAFQREPRLLTRLLELSEAKDRALAELIARRQHWAADDPRARAATQLLHSIFRGAAPRLAHLRSASELTQAIDDDLAVMRQVFSA
ncbi:MAG: TetR family transcriptional regulator [Leifsonia sp.]|nr:TetR family transcriptional regulator [Leifsonia sp.]|tara:strand:- start:267811 stop:268416 length:606 start_codon:yes stop_codon:yes gene_type:complete